jgi:hypothetical protein
VSAEIFIRAASAGISAKSGFSERASSCHFHQRETRRVSAQAGACEAEPASLGTANPQLNDPLFFDEERADFSEAACRLEWTWQFLDESFWELGSVPPKPFQGGVRPKADASPHNDRSRDHGFRTHQ